MLTKNIGLRGAAPGILMALTATAGLAQGDVELDVITAGQEPEKAVQARGAPMLEEIVVTAQRRSESLQDTPISIAAFNAEALEQRGIEGVDDLLGQVPSLTLEAFPTHNATMRVFIRGVGVYDSQLTQDPAVGIYIDGVYVARSVGLALDVADLERIEVLRGPQGTLYGRNTTGGAINLITRRPEFGETGGAVKLSLGNQNHASTKLSVSLPLGDALAMRVAALGMRKDGFVDNTAGGGDFGDKNQTGARVDLRWQPISGFIADYGFEYADLNYFNQLHQAILLPRTDKGPAELIKPFAVAESRYSERRLEALASGPPLEESGSRITGHSLSLVGSVGSGELKYLGSWRQLVDREYADLGGGAGSLDYRLDSHAYDGPAADVANGGPTPLVVPTLSQTQWSHELQFKGTALDGRLDFITGLYFFHEEGVEDRHQLNHQFSSGIAPEQINQFGLSDLIAMTNNGRLVQFVDLWWSIDNQAIAAFGQATWTPDFAAQRLHLTAGYRHSEDRREAVKFRVADTYVEELAPDGSGSAQLLSSGEFFDFVPVSQDFSDDALSFIAAWDVSDDVNVYAKAVEAYKSGGFNVRDPHVSGDSGGAEDFGFGFVDGFGAEYVTSYEAGIKSQWLKSRLRVNADLFYSDYRDMQINFLLPATIADTKARNAGKARLSGAELDLTYALSRGVTLMADYSWLDAKVLEVIDVNGNNVADLFPFSSAPPKSYVLAMDASLFRGAWGGEVRAHLSYNYTGRRQGVVISEERRGLSTIPAYGLFNARFAINDLVSGRLDLALWGRNLADKIYPIIAIDNLPHSDRAVVWGEPISFGLDLNYRFGG